MTQENNKIRVLVIDDDEDDYLIIRHFMSNIPDSPYVIEWEPDATKATELINKRIHDVYLVDYRLNDQTGLDVLRTLNLVDRTQPFIILTGVGDEQIEREAMRLGAADYLVKGSFDSELLSRVLRHSIQRKQMEAQRVQQLMDLNRSKDEFIALASHQLRTPATAVKQYVSMVLEGYAGAVSEEQQALLQSAYDSNERQILIVNDILRVAKLDLEKIVLQKQQMNATTKVKNVIRDLAPVFQKRSQTISLDAPEKPIMIDIDKEYIRMALSNIVDNASKYTPEGKAIRVTVKSLDKFVCIAIRDEGVGIAEEDMDKLFRKFSRIDNPLSVQVGGTGLGLYWSKEIIELHGGTVDVDSKVNKGTTFTVKLPL